MQRPRLVAAVAALALLAGCGTDAEPETATPPTPATTAKPADFPSAKGKTLAELSADMPEGLVFAPSVSVLEQGDNRVGFALFDASRKQIDASAVALYAARPDGTGLRGPYVARPESIRTKPAFQSRQAAAELEQGDRFFVADVPFKRKGSQVLTALARLDGRLVATSSFELQVGKEGGPPDVGDPAVRVPTLTPADVGGDLSKLSTRVPPLPDFHDADLSEAVGREPVVLVFATPQLCQTRVCGPVVDIAAQVKEQAGEGVTFIHQEIYENDDPSKGFRKPVGAWMLPTEPWIFVIDRAGMVAERFEGAVSVDELRRAVERVK